MGNAVINQKVTNEKKLTPECKIFLVLCKSCAALCNAFAQSGCAEKVGEWVGRGEGGAARSTGFHLPPGNYEASNLKYHPNTNMNIGKSPQLHNEDKKLCRKVAWVPPGTWQSVICLQYSGECKVSPYYKYVYEYWRRRRRCSMVDWELIFCPITPGSQITQILTQTARCMQILLLPNGSIWMRCVRESVERLRSNG